MDQNLQTPFPQLKHLSLSSADLLSESLQSFCGISDIPVTFFNAEGHILWECHTENRLCKFFDIYTRQGSTCTKKLISSIKLAAELGEAYVFVCKSGFVKIAFSLLLHGEHVGCFMAGPLVMGRLRESVISNIFSMNAIDPDDYPKIILFLRNMKVYQPKDVSYLGTLLSSCILAAITPNDGYLSVNSQYIEQRKIGEDLQKCKKENRATPYPYDVENLLIDKVRDGDIQQSIALLKRLLNEISLIEAGNLPSIKTKVLGICTILSRLASEKSGFSQDVSDAYFYDMNMLTDATSFQQLTILSLNFVESLVKSISETDYAGNSQIIKLALQNIGENYKNKISLKTVAQSLHVNPSYFSMLFKQEMGVTFTDYLMQFRIRKSCEILASHHNHPLVEVATLSGFDDQSYFSKVFRKIMGMTPKEYRKTISMR